MSNVFVIIKMCYVHNQWYDISCATVYNCRILPLVSRNTSNGSEQSVKACFKRYAYSFGRRDRVALRRRRLYRLDNRTHCLHTYVFNMIISISETSVVQPISTRGFPFSLNRCESLKSVLCTRILYLSFRASQVYNI